MTLPAPDYERHGIRLYCADCLDLLPKMADASVDLIVTDPPYGHNNNNGDLIHRWEAALGRLPSGADSPQGRPIANDGPEANELFRDFLPHAKRLLRHGGCCCCCCCGGGGPDPQFARWSMWLNEVLDFKQMIVWDKGPMGMGWHYRRSYETVLVATKPGGPCKWYDTTNRIENVIRPDSGIRKIIPRAEDHPTPKPVALAKHFIRLHSAPDDVVLDPFAGHAWVAEACVQTGRNFIGIEIDREHHEAAVKRVEAAFAEYGLFMGGAA